MLLLSRRELLHSRRLNVNSSLGYRIGIVHKQEHAACANYGRCDSKQKSACDGEPAQ